MIDLNDPLSFGCAMLVIGYVTGFFVAWMKFGGGK